MIPLAEAQTWLATQIPRRAPETILRAEASGRTLAADVPLQSRPARPTALVDGFAVRSADTEGASDYAPIPIHGAAVQAGDPMPPGADAVLEASDGFHAHMAVAPGHGVAPAGHDVPPGAVLAAGTLLTPLYLALLVDDPPVHPRPSIVAPPPFAALIAALIAAENASVHANPTHATPDLILTEACLTTIHAGAIAIRPGETTALGFVGNTPAIRLPRHLAAQATIIALLVAPLLRHLAGHPEPTPVQATLSRKIASALGQLDAVRVRVEGSIATPLGPADGIGLLAAAAANGLVLVSEGSEGYPAGATVPISPL